MATNKAKGENTPCDDHDDDLNVLFIQLDQHHSDILGCYGNPVVKTPNLDRLAREGVLFENAVCATPYCTPTRASFITGQWPHTHGVLRNTNERFALKVDITEEILLNNGYQVEHFGKWHVGEKEYFSCYKNSKSQKQYEEENLEAINSSGIKPFPPAGDDEVLVDRVYMTKWNFERYESSDTRNLLLGRDAVPLQYNMWNQLADKCVEWLKEHRDSKFMLTYSAIPPHALWYAPEPYYSLYDPKKLPLSPSFIDNDNAYTASKTAIVSKQLGESGIREKLRCYYAQVTMMDEIIGKILDALDELNLTEKTLVVYVSDHGDMLGAHGYYDKSIQAFYEEILKVPLIMRLPGKIRVGEKIKTHANSVDIAPTILDYAGIEIPDSIQGRSLRQVVEGKVEDITGYGFCERPGGRMIRGDGYKYSFYYKNDLSREELFNLQEDPHEMRNLANIEQYANIKARLIERLSEHLDKTGDMSFEQLLQTSNLESTT